MRPTSQSVLQKGPKIKLYEKTAKKKRRASWFSQYFGQSSRPSSGDLMKMRIVVTICSKTATVDI